MEYTFTQLFWLFLIYSFIGWIIEAAMGTIKNRSFINRGFSTGPFCLVYGAGAILMTVTLTELLDNFFLLFVSCAIQATIVEWITGKTLERLNHHKWWDYSDKKWNFDGYICFQYTVLWGILGVICLKGGNPLFMTLYRQIPEPVTSILVWVLMGYVLLDALVSLAAALHLRTSSTGQSRLVLIRFAEHRMAKAYPVIQEKTEEILREGKFAEGCGFYKLFWLFLIGSLLGDITETIFCRLTAGEWMFRSSLVWGPFSVVWGFAIVLATALLYKDRDKPDRHIFLIGTFLGGAYEYTCSVLSELVFGQVFWDYSEIPFNLGGRVNLLYCFFWGIAAVVWIKGLYPHFLDREDPKSRRVHSHLDPGGLHGCQYPCLRRSAHTLRRTGRRPCRHFRLGAHHRHPL